MEPWSKEAEWNHGSRRLSRTMELMSIALLTWQLWMRLCLVCTSWPSSRHVVSHKHNLQLLAWYAGEHDLQDGVMSGMVVNEDDLQDGVMSGDGGQ